MLSSHARITQFARVFSIILFGATIAFLTMPHAARAQCIEFSRSFGPNGLGSDGEIRCMLTVGTGAAQRLIVGGRFNRIGGQAAGGVAMWDGSTWTPMGTGVQTTFALAMYDDGHGPKLYAGGTFLRRLGGAADYLAVWDGNAWNAVPGNFDGPLLSLITHHDGTSEKLLAAGAFQSVDGLMSPGLAAWNGQSWSSVGNNAPGSISNHSSTADRFGRVVVFGGLMPRFGSNPVNTTLLFNGTEWKRVTPAFSPPARYDHAAAYDSTRSLSVIFGGAVNVNNALPPDTYVWNGSTWALQSTAANPGARIAAAMSFDEVAQRSILFGGRSDPFPSSNPVGDTWAFDGSNWTQVATTGPSPRSGHAMAYDPDRQCIVLFGGYSPSLGSLNDTWIWSNNVWTLAPTPGGPNSRVRPGLAFDRVLRRVVMFGESYGNPPYDGQKTWSWSGTRWEQIASDGPSPNTAGILFASPSSGSVIFQGVVGNAADVWELQPNGWRFLASAPDGLSAVASYQGDLYVGGPIGNLGRGGFAPFAKIQSDLAWIPMSGVFAYQSQINAIKHYQGKLALLGAFTPINAGTHPNFLLTDWQSLQNPTLTRIDAPSISDFATVDFGAGPVLVALSPYGVHLWNGTDWSIIPGSPPRCLAAATFGEGANQRLMIGGDFTAAAGNPAGGIVRYGDPCAAPTITQQPQSVIAFLGQNAWFEVVAEGTNPITYQWFKDGIQLRYAQPYSGVDTPSLAITNFTNAQYGVYQCRVTNSLGVIWSDTAEATKWIFPGNTLAPNVIAATGLRIPNPSGRIPLALGTPLAAADGSVIYRETSQQFGIAYVLERNGLYLDFARSGVQAPGFPPNSFQQLRSLQRSGSSGGALMVDITGATTTTALYKLGDQPPALIVKLNDALPGLPAGQILRTLDSTPLIGADGDLAFSGTIRTQASSTSLGRGIWRRTEASGIQFVTAQGRFAPGTRTPFTNIPEVPAIGDDGSVIFRGVFGSRTGYGRTSDSGDDGLWIASDAGTTRLAVRPDRSPRMPANSNIDDVFNYRKIGDGSVVFSAYVCGPSNPPASGVFRVHQGVLTDLALPGQTLPTFDGTPAGMIVGAEWLNANARGDIILKATLDNGDSGLWVLDHRGFRRVFDLHVVDPFLPPSTVLQGISDGAIDDNGHVVFQVNGTLRGDGTSFVPFTAVYGSDPRTGVFPIVLPGTRVILSPSESRIAASAELGKARSETPDRFDPSGPFADDGSLSLLINFGINNYAVVSVGLEATRNLTACPVDFNADGFVDFFDFVAYLDCFEGLECPPASAIRPARSPDTNQDGFADFFDFIDFIDEFTQGC